MDYQEVIERLERGYLVDSNGDTTQKDIEALKIAISALQELKAIHNNGISLERLKDIDIRKQVVEHINYIEYMDIKDELEDFKKLGALKEVRKAVEKQKPEKTVIEDICRNGVDFYGIVYQEKASVYKCPACDSFVGFVGENQCISYCACCGQKLDWSEVEE